MNNMLTLFFIRLMNKMCTTSYENTLNPDFFSKKELANRAISGNGDETPPLAILIDSGKLLTALMGFVLYLLVLTGLKPILLAVVTVTTAISFFVSRYIGDWDARHKQERVKYQYRMSYVYTTVNSNKMPKDIRIFHMTPWLMEIYDKALELYRGYINRRERYRQPYGSDHPSR